MYPWFEPLWQKLCAQQQKGALPHALLLDGVKGLGKLDFAKAFSHWLLCENKGANGACGHCKSCLLFEKGHHPDFFLLEPQEKSKVIKIDQVRKLTQSLNQTSHQGGMQVAILNPCDAMNRASANALLKTLEEPSGDVILILVTSERHRLLPTIQSRVQRINMVAQSPELMRAWLARELDEKADIDLLLRLSDQAPLKARALYQANALSLRHDLFAHLGLIYQSRKNPISDVGAFLKQDVNMLFDFFSGIASDVLRLMMGARSAQLVHQDEIKKLTFLQKRLSMVRLLGFIDELNRARALVQTAQGVNVQLVLESLFLKWSDLRGENVS